MNSQSGDIIHRLQSLESLRRQLKSKESHKHTNSLIVDDSQGLDQNVDNLFQEWQHKKETTIVKKSILDINTQAIWEQPEFQDFSQQPKETARTEIQYDDENLLDTDNMFELKHHRPVRPGVQVQVLSARNSAIYDTPKMLKHRSELKLNNANNLKAGKSQLQNYADTIQYKTEPSFQTNKLESLYTKQLQQSPSTMKAQKHQVKSNLTKRPIGKQKNSQPTITPLSKHSISDLKLKQAAHIIKTQEYNIINQQLIKIKKDLAFFYDKHLKTKKGGVDRMQAQIKQLIDEFRKDYESTE